MRISVFCPCACADSAQGLWPRPVPSWSSARLYYETSVRGEAPKGTAMPGAAYQEGEEEVRSSSVETQGVFESSR